MDGETLSPQATEVKARIAGLEDVPHLLSYGRKFHEYSPWRHLPYSEDAARRMLTRLIDDDNGVVLIHDYGLLMGYMAPSWIADDYLLAQEIAWWADRKGGVLLRAFEEWAKSKGASGVLMIHLETGDSRVAEIYDHMGYAPVEHTYMKRL